MATVASDVVAKIRELSSLFNNNLFDDTAIIGLYNDGAGELYDWMVGTFETWFLDKVDFSLPFIGQTDPNVFPMPMDLLLKDNTLEMNPSAAGRVPLLVPRLSTWSDRFQSGGPTPCGGRRYFPAGSNLMVFPANNSAGNYRLWYTPKYIPIALPSDPVQVAIEPWVLYPEIHASIAIRTSRQQDTADLQGKLASLKQRIETAVSNRTEEVAQSPLRDGNRWGNYWYGLG